YPDESSETAEIISAIREESTAVTELDKQMPETVVRLVSLATQKRAREQHLVLLRASLSPVRQVPAEILAYVFRYCVHENMHVYCVVSPRNAPMVLTHVRARWRVAALATPRLWE
ncbi:hypothetical protein B0H17DRAFT_906683, partial [Mycena rosella]